MARQCPKYTTRENVLLMGVWRPCVKMLPMCCLFMVCDGEIRSYGERQGREGGREAEGAGRDEDLCKKTLMKLQAQQTT